LQNDPEGAAELLCDLGLFWSRGGHNEEAIGWLRLALATTFLANIESKPYEARKLHARALFSLSILSLQQEYPDVQSVLQQSIERLRDLGETADLAMALAVAGFLGDLEAAQESVALARTVDDSWILAYCLAWQSQALRLAGGDLQLAQRAAAESTALARQLRSDWAVARALLGQGQLAVASGELQAARACLQESMVLFSQSQDSYHANMARLGLAQLERQQGNYGEARRLYQAGILVWQDWGLRAAIAQALESLVLTSAAQGHLQDALRLAGAAQKLRQETGTQPTPGEQRELDEGFEAVRGRLPASLYSSLLAEGQGMTASDAVAYALGLPAI
jgi:hypothetical protein